MLPLTRHRRHAWRNWSGSVRCEPASIVRPTDLGGIVEAVSRCARAGRRLRVAGAGHSFVPLVATDDTLLSLDRFQGIEEVDRDAGTVTVRAGTSLRRLGRDLHALGLAQENLGDIDAQALGGAVGTGTHGTGASFGSISTQVVGLTLVTPTGEVLRASADRRRDLFDAGRLSLGALGVLAKLTLRVVPAFRLRYRAESRALDDCLADFGRLAAEHRHFEFFWFPHTERVFAKTHDVTEEVPDQRGLAAGASELVVENWAFWLVSELARAFPRLSRPVSRLSARVWASPGGVRHSHEAFATRRSVRFLECEYALPREAVPAAFDGLRTWLGRERFPVHFPVECRMVARDGIWLSPAYRRDSAFVAVHAYRGMPYEEYFAAAEEVFRELGGRPHWAKLHSLTAADLRPLYPRWDAFLTIRQELDPEGILLNPYLHELFGIA